MEPILVQPDELSVTQRALTGLELAGRICLWLVMLLPLTLYFLGAAAFDLLKKPRPKPA